MCRGCLTFTLRNRVEGYCAVRGQASPPGQVSYELLCAFWMSWLLRCAPLWVRAL